MARVIPKIKKQRGVQHPSLAASIASMPFLRQNAHDPPVLSVGKSFVLNAAMGAATPLGPVGAVLGGAFGLITGLFGANAKSAAERRRLAEERRQHEEQQRRYKEQVVDTRKQQIAGMRDQYARNRQERKVLLHQELGRSVASIQTPQMALSFQVTGRQGKITAENFNKLLSAETRMAVHKIEDDIALQDIIINEFDDWQEKIDVGGEEGFKAAKDESSLERVKGLLKQQEV